MQPINYSVNQPIIQSTKSAWTWVEIDLNLKKSHILLLSGYSHECTVIDLSCISDFPSQHKGPVFHLQLFPPQCKQTLLHGFGYSGMASHCCLSHIHPCHTPLTTTCLRGMWMSIYCLSKQQALSQSDTNYWMGLSKSISESQHSLQLSTRDNDSNPSFHHFELAQATSH